MFLERDVVVEILGVLLRGSALARPRGCWLAPVGRGLPRAELDLAAGTIARTADQLHAIADDFRRVFLDAVLVGVLARLQSPLDINRASLLQVFAGDLGGAAEE